MCPDACMQETPHGPVKKALGVGSLQKPAAGLLQGCVMRHAFKVEVCLQSIEIVEDAHQSAIICAEKRLQHQTDKQLRLRVGLGTVSMRIRRQGLFIESKSIPLHAHG